MNENVSFDDNMLWRFNSKVSISKCLQCSSEPQRVTYLHENNESCQFLIEEMGDKSADGSLVGQSLSESDDDDDDLAEALRMSMSADVTVAFR